MKDSLTSMATKFPVFPSLNLDANLWYIIKWNYSKSKIMEPKLELNNMENNQLMYISINKNELLGSSK